MAGSRLVLAALLYLLAGGTRLIVGQGSGDVEGSGFDSESGSGSGSGFSGDGGGPVVDRRCRRRADLPRINKTRTARKMEIFLEIRCHVACIEQVWWTGLLAILCSCAVHGMHVMML